jgi:hypothetical protein
LLHASAEEGADFASVIRLGLARPEVAAVIRRGTPVLQRAGCFMAGIVTHPSAEPGTLVVRYDEHERQWLLADAPEIHYLTEHYERWPLNLVRLSRITPEALRDLLAVSWRLIGTKTRPTPPAGGGASRHCARLYAVRDSAPRRSR